MADRKRLKGSARFTHWLKGESGGKSMAEGLNVLLERERKSAYLRGRMDERMANMSIIDRIVHSITRRKRS